MLFLTTNELDFIIKKASKSYKSPLCSPFRKRGSSFKIILLS